MAEPQSQDRHSGRTSANNLDDGITRLDKTLNKIYLPEIMAARRVIHSRMRRKRDRQLQGAPRGGPTLYDYIMESRRRKAGSQQVGIPEESSEEMAEDSDKNQHSPPNRQDSVFQSVDLSEIAGLREDPNRTPTPLPTFTHGPPQEHNEGHSDHKSEAVAALSTVSQKSRVNSRSSSGQSSSRSEEIVHEQYELQVKPGYADAHQIEMATAACQSKERAQLQRSNSFHQNRTERRLEERVDSTASDPGESRERSVRKKQSRQSNDLDLAQKIILKRKVEEYIENQGKEEALDQKSEKQEEAVETAWEKELQASESAVLATNTHAEKTPGRDSVQTVVSHKSDSEVEEEQINKVDDVAQEERLQVAKKERAESVSKENHTTRPESASSRSRPSTAGSDLNPHPVIPPIGTPPVPGEPHSDDDGTNTPPVGTSGASEDMNNATVAGAATTAVVAAGGGAAAAMAINANKSKEKQNEPAGKTKENTAPKLSAKPVKTKEDKAPKVEKAKKDVSRENKRDKPTKQKESDKKKPISLNTMGSAEMKSTIDALEKMVDANIQGVIEASKGKTPATKSPEADRRMVKAVMNPAFQAEINSFLAQT